MCFILKQPLHKPFPVKKKKKTQMTGCCFSLTIRIHSSRVDCVSYTSWWADNFDKTKPRFTAQSFHLHLFWNHVVMFYLSPAAGTWRRQKRVYSRANDTLTNWRHMIHKLCKVSLSACRCAGKQAVCQGVCVETESSSGVKHWFICTVKRKSSVWLTFR